VHDDATEHDEPGDHHRVAVATLGTDEARQSDRSRRAGDVVDRHDTHEARLLQRMLHRARRLIPSAAGCGRRHDPQFLELLSARRDGGDEDRQ
jgi:hypothetical protein